MQYVKIFFLVVTISFGVVLLGIIGIGVIANIQNGDIKVLGTTSPQSSLQTSTIECFIEGKAVYTTRENCAELSKQRPAEVKVIPQQPSRPMPTFNLTLPTKKPKYTRCEDSYSISGRYEGIKCYDSFY